MREYIVGVPFVASKEHNLHALETICTESRLIRISDGASVYYSFYYQGNAAGLQFVDKRMFIVLKNTVLHNSAGDFPLEKNTRVYIIPDFSTVTVVS